MAHNDRSHAHSRGRNQDVASPESSLEPAEPSRGTPAMWAGVAGLIVVHLVLATAAAWNKCATFDEASHLANGYSIWATGDYRMFPVGLATQRWMTLPLIAAGVPGPATDQPLWHGAHNWDYGRQILFETKLDGEKLLREARFMTSLLSAALALLTFVWARRLFGTAGGFVALTLYVLNPTVLAHGALATLDMGASLAILAAMTSLWSVLHRFTYGRLALSAIVWGLAFCAKFSTLLIIPMGLILVGVRIFDGRAWDVPKSALRRITGAKAKAAYGALVMGAHVVGVWLVIWALFGFQFDTFREYPNDPQSIYTGTFDEVAAQAPRYTGLLRFARENRLLPEAYLYSFADTVRTTEGRVSYLDGWFGIYGFKSFFPLAFAYKTPLAVFGFVLLGLAAHAARRMHQVRIEKRAPLSLLWEGTYRVLPLIVILVVYGATAILGGMNIGIRHILPLFAPLFILCGLAGEWITAALRRFGDKRELPIATGEATDGVTSRAAAVSEVAPPAGWPLVPDGALRSMFAGVVVMFVLLVGEVATAFPNYLAYFNAASGGTSGGYRHLVDSSLDWGQDLPALKEWLEEQGLSGGSGGPRVYLSYFGATPPSGCGFKIRRKDEDGLTLLPSFFDRPKLEPGLQQPFELGLSNGVYCISATMLQSVYLSPYNGPWITSYEARYRKVLGDLNYFERLKKADPAKFEEEKRTNGENWLRVFDEFDRVRFGRLCAYLRTREPLHVVNGSILVFRLSDQDLITALAPSDISRVRPDPPTIDSPREY